MYGKRCGSTGDKDLNRFNDVNLVPEIERLMDDTSFYYILFSQSWAILYLLFYLDVLFTEK